MKNETVTTSKPVEKMTAKIVAMVKKLSCFSRNLDSPKAGKREERKNDGKNCHDGEKNFRVFQGFYEISDSEKVGRGREKGGERRSRSRLTENDEDS